MSLTPNYSFIIPTGSDAVNLLTQCYPNFTSLDSILKPIQESGVTVATNTKVGTVHQLVRTDSSCNMFRFIATGNYASGDTFTVDGTAVTATAMDGTSLPAGAFVINQSVVCVLNNLVLTVLIAGKETTSLPASAITYDNTGSGLSATNAQDAIDEVVTMIPAEHGLYELWKNPDMLNTFDSTTINLNGFDSSIWDAVEIEYIPTIGLGYKMGAEVLRFEKDELSGGSLNAQITTMTLSNTGILTKQVRQLVITLAGTTLSFAFDDCTKTDFATYGASGSSSTANGLNVPFRILGLKHNS